jgi:hypothetical protein
MSLVNITNITMDNNPAPFDSPIKMTVTFEVLKELDSLLDWK